MVSIDGIDISDATIDGTDVQEITVDGDTVWTSTVTWETQTVYDRNDWFLDNNAFWDKNEELVKTNDGSDRTEGQLVLQLNRAHNGSIFVEADVYIGTEGTFRINIGNQGWNSSDRNDGSNIGFHPNQVEFYDYGTELRTQICTSADGSSSEILNEVNYTRKDGFHHIYIEIWENDKITVALDGTTMINYNADIYFSGDYVSFESSDYTPLGPTSIKNVTVSY